tara:strand:+ start:1491 stop:2801 length:1311 start_codon:yes stop_codon:yes gene_type:complete
VIQPLYQTYLYLFGYPKSVKFVTINMGGRNHNPFEYLFKTKDNDVFIDYKKKLGGLTLYGLKQILNNEKFNNYNNFITFVNSLGDESLFEYFFNDEKDSKTKLKLDSKIGRLPNSYRLNPIEHGYDEVYFDSFKGNQYQYVKASSINNEDISGVYLKCLEIFYNNINEYNETDLYNIILFDLMNIDAVFNYHTEFDKIYTDKNEDTRIKQIISDGIPAIIVTQEKPLNKYVGLELISSSQNTNGTKVYKYNLDDSGISDISFQDTGHHINNMMGNIKGCVTTMNIYNQTVRVTSLHCKDQTKVSDVNNISEFVKNGITPLFTNDDSIELVMGDFNPNTNEISNQIKDETTQDSDINYYPPNNTNTTKKVRSGYCAQMSKMFKSENSELSKDIIFYRYNQEDIKINNTKVYPKTNELLSDTWCGDHSYISVTIDFPE